MFRTYNASITLDKLLNEMEEGAGVGHGGAAYVSRTLEEKKADYDRANKEVRPSQGFFTDNLQSAACRRCSCMLASQQGCPAWEALVATCCVTAWADAGLPTSLIVQLAGALLAGALLLRHRVLMLRLICSLLLTCHNASGGYPV